MKKRVPMYIVILFLLSAAFSQAVYAKDSEPGTKVAIAWSNTPDGYAF